VNFKVMREVEITFRVIARDDFSLGIEVYDIRIFGHRIPTGALPTALLVEFEDMALQKILKKESS